MSIHYTVKLIHSISKCNVALLLPSVNAAVVIRLVMSVCLRVCLSVCLSTGVSVCLSVYGCVCLSVYGCVCLSDFSKTGPTKFIFCMQEHLHGQFVYQGHWLKVKVTEAKMHSWVVYLRLKRNLVFTVKFNNRRDNFAIFL